MSDQDVKQRLISYLDEHAFRPVLDANPDRYPPDQRDKLRSIQQTMRQERERFLANHSAIEVYAMFEDELRSEAARERHRTLRELGLPTLEDLRIDFQQMAGDLGLRIVEIT